MTKNSCSTDCTQAEKKTHWESFLEKVIKESFINAKGNLEISLGIDFGKGYKCKQYMYFRNQRYDHLSKMKKTIKLL